MLAMIGLQTHYCYRFGPRASDLAAVVDHVHIISEVL